MNCKEPYRVREVSSPQGLQLAREKVFGSPSSPLISSLREITIGSTLSVPKNLNGTFLVILAASLVASVLLPKKVTHEYASSGWSKSNERAGRCGCKDGCNS